MGRNKVKKIKKKRLPLFSSLDIKENFIDDLLMLLGAGMDILSAIKSIRQEFRRGFMARFLDDLATEIESGASLYEALSGRNILNDRALSLIKLGERSGRLVDNLEVIAVDQQKNRSFKSKIRSAVMYPVFVLFVAAVVSLAVTWFILPKISVVFSSLRVELPLITVILIGIGDFVSKYGYIVIPVSFIAVIVIIYFLFFFYFTKAIGQYLLLVSPVFGKLVRQAELARFGFILGTLLEAGLPLVNSLESLVSSSDTFAYKRFYRKLILAVEEGSSLHGFFNSYRYINFLFPPTVRQLVAAGEQSGNLSNILKKIGASYEEKMETTAKNLSILLEPILLFVVFLVVLAVAIAIILPIYSLVGSLQI